MLAEFELSEGTVSPQRIGHLKSGNRFSRLTFQSMLSDGGRMLSRRGGAFGHEKPGDSWHIFVDIHRFSWILVDVR